MSKRRWYIERSRGNGFDMDDVGALSMVLEPCGALRFLVNEQGEEIIYAPGSWVLVHDEIEAD